MFQCESRDSAHIAYKISDIEKNLIISCETKKEKSVSLLAAKKSHLCCSYNTQEHK